MNKGWLIEPLGDDHDRSQFNCGKPPLDEYIRKYASQNQKLGYGRSYVALRAGGSKRVDGYFTLAMSSVAFKELPENLAKRCPRYPMPVAHLGRLAVDHGSQRQGLGEMLLFEAIQRAISAADIIAARAIDVLAIDDEAKEWYARYGFLPFVDSPRHLFLPISTAREILSDSS